MTTASPASPVLGSGAHPSSGAPPSQLVALPIILAGIFMPALDFFIVNVAIPSLQKSLHAGPAAIQFFIAGYGLAYAAAMISGGRLGDLFGRRRIFCIGLAVFTVFSLGCAVSQTSAELIVARIGAGLGAALMTPQVMGMINTMYSGKQRVSAFQAYGIAGGLAGALGQLIGGSLISWNVAGIGWRAIFLINIPIGLAALLLAPRLLPESRGDRGSRLDLPGVFLIGAAMVAVVLPLTVGREQRWPVWTWVCLAATVPLLAAFARYQASLARKGGSPLIQIDMFRNRTFAVGTLMTLVLFLAMGSYFLFQAIYLQQGRGFSALGSGLVACLIGFGFFFSAGAAPALAVKLHRQVLFVGGIALALGYLLIALASLHKGLGGSVVWLMPGMAVAGFGMGMVVAPLSAMVLAEVEPRHAAAASGVLSTAQEVGGAFGVAFVGLVFFRLVGPAERLTSFPVAFEWSLVLAAGFGCLIAVLAQFMPAGPRPGTAPETVGSEAEADPAGAAAGK